MAVACSAWLELVRVFASIDCDRHEQPRDEDVHVAADGRAGGCTLTPSSALSAGPQQLRRAGSERPVDGLHAPHVRPQRSQRHVQVP